MISLCQSPLGCSRCRKLRRLFGNNGFNSIEMYNFCCISLTPPSFVLPDIRFRQNGVSYSSAEVAVHFKRNRGLWNRGVRHAHTHLFSVSYIGIFGFKHSWRERALKVRRSGCTYALKARWRICRSALRAQARSGAKGSLCAGAQGAGTHCDATSVAGPWSWSLRLPAAPRRSLFGEHTNT